MYRGLEPRKLLIVQSHHDSSTSIALASERAAFEIFVGLHAMQIPCSALN